jgi:hypothetical protein
LNSIISIENSLLFIGLVSVLFELDLQRIRSELDFNRIKSRLNALKTGSNRIFKINSWLITLIVRNSRKTGLHSFYRICQVRAP